MSKLNEYRESLIVKEEEKALNDKKEAAKRMNDVNKKLRGVKIKSSNSKRYEYDSGYDIPEENDDER